MKTTISLVITPELRLNQAELQDLYRTSISPFLTTPRNIKRFLNTLRATFPLVRNEVNVVDFIGIQILRHFAPATYDFIAANKGAFLPPILGNTQKEEAFREEGLKVALDHDWRQDQVAARQAAHDTVAKLFPRLPASHMFEDRKNCRILDPEIFDRYFRLRLTPDEISETDFQKTMSLLPDFNAFGQTLKQLASEKRLDGTDRLRMFFVRLKSMGLHEIPEINLRSFLDSIYSVGDELVSGDLSHSYPWANDWQMILVLSREALKLSARQRERPEILRPYLMQAKALFTVVIHLHAFDLEHENNGNQELLGDYTLAKEDLDPLKKLAVERMKTAMPDGSLQKLPSLEILHCYEKWEGLQEIQKYVARLIETDEGFCDFLAGMLSGSLDNIRHFLGTANQRNIQDRCIRILETSPTWLTEKHREALNKHVAAVDDE